MSKSGAKAINHIRRDRETGSFFVTYLLNKRLPNSTKLPEKAVSTGLLYLEENGEYYHEPTSKQKKPKRRPDKNFWHNEDMRGIRIPKKCRKGE